MCNIIVCNLNNESLNKKAFLILGTLGSPVHSDGWGVSTSKGFFKSTVPMYLSSVAGQNIEKVPGGGHLGALIGHIRQASPLIPIKLENCHPFVSPENNIIFVHNGKLVPKDEKKFVMEIDVPDLDAKGFKQYDKDNKLKMKKEKRSDSLIFFEEFLLTWQENQKAGDTKTQDAYFVEVLKKTMEKFTGKFAFSFRINGVTYIVRGKTADLHIVYLLDGWEKGSKQLGWVVDTDKKILDLGVSLLHQLSQLEHKKDLPFTVPELLAEETIYRAEKTDLVKIGTIKENAAPVQSYLSHRGTGYYDADYGTAFSGFSDTKTKSDEYAQKIFDFMISYKLSTVDVQNIMYIIYGLSMIEATTSVYEHFCTVVIPRLQNLVKGKTKKYAKKSWKGRPYISTYFYYNLPYEYPWIFNPDEKQLEFIETTKSHTQ